MTKSSSLEPGKYYHIYNRGNNRENIFFEERNYQYFMQLYGKYIEPVAETFAYCLMRNHFHLLVRVKTSDASIITTQSTSHTFNNLFNSYAKAINKAYNRTGSLFQKHFGRIEVGSDRYFAALVNYIHRNPQKHGFVNDFREYPYSSYNIMLSDKPTFLSRSDVLEWLGGKEHYEQFHGVMADTAPIVNLIIDDE